MAKEKKHESFLEKIEEKIVHDIEKKPSAFVKSLNIITLISSIICYAILIWFVIFEFGLIRSFFGGDFDKLRTYINSDYRVIIFIGAFIVNFLLSLNPFAQLVPIVSMISFFYGFRWGLFFGITNFFVATFITIHISRHLGGKVVRKIIGEKNWKRANLLADEEGLLPFNIAYLFPVFPNAIISWIAGITRLSVLKLAIGATIFQSPGIVIGVLVGSGYVTQNWFLSIGLFLGLCLTAILMATNRKKILKLINRKTN